jgi:RecA-family ATPase
MNGKSENMAGAVGALGHQLERVAEKTGAAVMFSHHFTKGNSKKKACRVVFKTGQNEGL